MGNREQEDLPVHYSAVDLVVLPSHYESFGLVALEAMACSVPVISSNTGGIPEVNAHGVSGLLSNAGDVDDMTKNALHILKNEEVLQTFKANAKQEAVKFDIHKIVPLYEALYEQTLSKCMLLK